jgi:putative transposase
VVIRIAGRTQELCRAAHQNGYVLSEIVKTPRNTKAAKRLLTCLLKKQGCPPRRLITDKLEQWRF